MELQENIRFYEIATSKNLNFSTFERYQIFLLDTSWHFKYSIIPVQIKLKTDSLRLFSVFKREFEFTNGISGIETSNFGDDLNDYYLIGISNTNKIYYLSGHFCKNFDKNILMTLCFSIEDFYQLIYWNYQLRDIKVKKKLGGYKISAYSEVLRNKFKRNNL